MTKTYTWRVPLLLCWDLNAAFFRTALLMPVMCQLLVYLCQVLVQLFTFQTLKIRVPAEAQDQYGDLYSWGRAEFDVLVDPPPLQAAFLKIFSWQGSKFNLDCNTICVCTGMCLGLVQFSSIEILRIHPWSAWLPVQGASQGGWTTGEGQPICSSSVAGSLLFASSNFYCHRFTDNEWIVSFWFCAGFIDQPLPRLQLRHCSEAPDSWGWLLFWIWCSILSMSCVKVIELRSLGWKQDPTVENYYKERWFGTFWIFCRRVLSSLYSMRKFPNVLSKKFLARSICKIKGLASSAVARQNLLRNSAPAS